MRSIPCILAAPILLALAGCGQVFVAHTEQQSREQMLARATHVIAGVIEDQRFEIWPAFRVSLPDGGSDPRYWSVLRRTLRVEAVLLGSEPRESIDVHETFWTGGASGDWNSTRKGERAIFPLRVEHGRYRLVRDWRRSIFLITTGPHNRLPLDERQPLWERIALMNYWIETNNEAMRIEYPYFSYLDPAGALSQWRIVKLQRGLVRHPSPDVRMPACRELILLMSWGQDECWEMLSVEDRKHIRDGGYLCCSGVEVTEWRARNEKRSPDSWWNSHRDQEERRLLTAINNRRLRTEFCRRWDSEYPGDQDTGCPADLPPPATIVTENGDVPLRGDWPR